MKPICSHFLGAVAVSFAVAAGTATLATAQSFAQAFDPTIASKDADDWLYAPLTPGEFQYVDEQVETLALFGGDAATHLFVIRCDRRTREVGIARRGEIEGQVPMTVRTETLSRTVMASQVPDNRLIAISLPANDPLLDAIAVTKGRFAIEVQGQDTLYIPPWGEVIRVIEDCR